MGKWVTDHRKAITGAVLGAAAAVIAALSAGSSPSWQVLVVAGVAGALGVGAPVYQVRNGRKPAKGSST
jgi:hypothetical protein